MTVKDVICKALRLLGKDDIAKDISYSFENNTAINAECERYYKLFMLLADSVERELYSGYFPDATTVELTVTNGVCDLSTLSLPFVKVVKLTDCATDGEVKNFEVKDQSLLISDSLQTVRLTYEYTSKGYDGFRDEIDESKKYLSPDVMVAGMVAEYYCTIGDTVNAALWQEKYENKIKLIRESGNYVPYSAPQVSPSKSVSLPRRRWI